ncbi:Glycosyltransferase [Lunatimonas lonarensis]|uniref:Glycosyltransferase n=1 Tax=Lunatimonas lonarensis TaxID=1232681 RepID=R7ZV52_9BACT|nr:glycosyltransferase [Lunatimonas lonarensis]EON78015.1 Glycosyltransferase [Lunatimonas lonarensis]
MRFSVIIPVYNRPEEIEALLNSLCAQSCTDFEVIVIDDGSSVPCKHVVSAFKERIHLTYVYQQNTGQGFARNTGMQQAAGDFFLFFDSDCQLPSEYMENLRKTITARKLDAFGGPDNAKEDFGPWQKAMNFSMTSFWTTGGIRGKLKDPAKYQARGYNMGFSRKVFEQVGGFRLANQAEDIEISMRIKKAGFKLELVREAWVYHHRKSTFLGFARQSFQFGTNRIHVSRIHPEALQPVHLLPLGFLLAWVFLPFIGWVLPVLFLPVALFFLIWAVGVVVSASWETRSVLIGFLALVTSVAQLSSYGAGIAVEGIRSSASGDQPPRP